MLQVQQIRPMQELHLCKGKITRSSCSTHCLSGKLRKCVNPKRAMLTLPSSQHLSIMSNDIQQYPMLPSSQHLPTLPSNIQSDTTLQRIAPATATPPIADPTFNLDSLDAQSFIRMIGKAYAEVVHWKLNLSLSLLVRQESNL